MVYWDIDRYEALQDSAWEHDSSAADEDAVARRDERLSNSQASRTKAGAARAEAAQMLVQYWLPRSPGWSNAGVQHSG